ncbi:MAG TPA: FKBP-type peptidyl-prolyl cis-trans isomerase [Polyangiaceae bacterium]|nr:FKBP-type peptidyl-prolyl cis-trans isomerase [Polyangiaceae bacterium]
MSGERSERPPRAAGGYQVGPGMWVRVGYRAFDEDGEPVEECTSQVEYVHGLGALLPALEAAIDGQLPGAKREVVLPPRDAFGPRRKEALVEFDRADFPPGVAAGDRFDADTADGGVMLLRVMEVGEDVVVVDMNHPLAGQRVRFELEVQEVRLATAEETQAAERRLSGPEQVDGPVIPVERLLRGPSQRYEMGPAAPAIEGGDDET